MVWQFPAKQAADRRRLAGNRGEQIHDSQPLRAFQNRSSWSDSHMLDRLTTSTNVVTISNMKATELISTRVAYSGVAFAELVLWRLAGPLAGSTHRFKYRLAYVVRGQCMLRYDNEAGKGDHRHIGGKESTYAFTTPEKLIADFQNDIVRWNLENPDP